MINRDIDGGSHSAPMVGSRQPASRSLRLSPLDLRYAASSILALILAFSLAPLPACSSYSTTAAGLEQLLANTQNTGRYLVLDEAPDFSEYEGQRNSFETYSKLDVLGRCGPAIACIGEDLMPTTKRDQISQVKPSGWHRVEYDFIEGKLLFNRCHLIAYSLTAENANERNLITGTQQLNETMTLFETTVREYIQKTGNHVLYRVTPVFEGTELVARGVQMEAMSVEDDGKAISFNVFIPNEQEGVEIDYATGYSWESGGATSSGQPIATSYVLNTSSKKFHLPSCPSIADINGKNKQESSLSREELIAEGYVPCGSCKP